MPATFKKAHNRLYSLQLLNPMSPYYIQIRARLDLIRSEVEKIDCPIIHCGRYIGIVCTLCSIRNGTIIN